MVPGNVEESLLKPERHPALPREVFLTGHSQIASLSLQKLDTNAFQANLNSPLSTPSSFVMVGPCGTHVRDWRCWKALLAEQANQRSPKQRASLVAVPWAKEQLSGLSHIHWSLDPRFRKRQRVGHLRQQKQTVI